MNCKGQKFGHNFAGGYCLDCKISQDELSGRGKHIATTLPPVKVSAPIIRKKNTGIHSRLHLLVDEIRKEFGETAKKGVGSFGFYLGHFKRLGVDKAYQIWSDVKQSNARDPKRLFWWKVKQVAVDRHKANDKV